MICKVVYSKELKDYEYSSDNMLQSIALYYNNGIMGKKKYRSVYACVSSNSSPIIKKTVHMTAADSPIPRLVPYHRLMSYINSIDIGKLYNVQDELFDKLKEEEKVVGCYRSLEELLIRFVEFYLSSDLYQMAMFREEHFPCCSGWGWGTFAKVCANGS